MTLAASRPPQPVFLACCITLAASAAAVAYGPDPRIQSTFQPGDSQVEIRDRVWLALWLLLPPALVAICGLPGIRRLGAELTRLAWVPHALFAPLALYLLVVPGEISLSWNGFGLGPTLFSLVVAGLWIRYRSSRWLNALLEVGAWALLARTAAFVFESDQRTVDVYHSQFTVDELLSFSAGRVPLVDYIPQYTSLLGLAPAALIRLLGVPPLRAALFSIVALKWATLGGLVWAQLRAFGPKLRWGHVAAVSVAALLCTHEGPLADRTLSSYHAVFPIRLFGPAMGYVALAHWLANPLGVRARPFLLGFVLAFGLLANIDFGLVAALAAAAVFAARLRVASSAHRRVEALWLLFGIVAFLALHLLVYRAVYGHAAHYEELTLFVRLFGERGLMNVSMQPLGLHSLVAFVAAYATWLAAGSLRDDARTSEWGAIMYLGIFCTGTLAYYTGRSLVSTLTGGSAIPVALLLAGSNSVVWSPNSPIAAPSAPWRVGRVAVGLCRALPVTVLLAALFFQPRVLMPRGSVIPVVELPPDLVRTLPPNAGLFANDGNLISLRSGVENSIPFSHTGYLSSAAGARIYCERLALGRYRHLLVQLQPNSRSWPDSDSGEVFSKLADSPSCQAVGIDRVGASALEARRARGEAWGVFDLRLANR